MGNINEASRAIQRAIETFLLPMGNINEHAAAQQDSGDAFLLPMGNINFKIIRHAAQGFALSTPYGKHKHLSDWDQFRYSPPFYSLWET